MSDMDITPEQIRAGRERRQMTQLELAKELGVSLRTVTSWEAGTSSPRNRTGALVEALSIEGSGKGYGWGPDAVKARVGQLAKQRREELGLSREVMAERTGLKSKQSIMNFEFARSMPNGDNLRAIEKVLEWKPGSIDEALETAKRASDLSMEDFDLFDRTPKARPLASYSTQELLEELIPRLEGIKGALGPSRTMAAPAPMDHQFLYGLAANTDPSHLERIAEEASDSGKPADD